MCFRSAGQRRHHHGRRSAIGVLLSLFWVFWSLLASAASQSCARQASPWSRYHCEWPVAAACWFTAPAYAGAIDARLTAKTVGAYFVSATADERARTQRGESRRSPRAGGLSFCPRIKQFGDKSWNSGEIDPIGRPQV